MAPQGKPYEPSSYKDDHTGSCSIASNNQFRYTNNDQRAVFVSENNSAQKALLDGGFCSYIDNDGNGKISVGDTIFWYTLGSGTNDPRRWNHYGTVKAADPSHPNRS